MTPGEPVWQQLETPRLPSDDERRLLAGLAAAVDEPLLHRQVGTAVVVAVCRCGCSSVSPWSDEHPVPEARVAQLSAGHPADYFHVEADGGSAQLSSTSFRGAFGNWRCRRRSVGSSLADVSDLTDFTVA